MVEGFASGATPARGGPPWDVVIAGGGMAGAILGILLGRRGRSVLLLEREGAPRFAVGEAGIKETSLSFARLAARWDVPELGALASVERIHKAIGPTCGRKASFSFLWHALGEAHRPEHTVQVGSPAFPFGVDAHLYRQDVDAWLLDRARDRGAALRLGAEVAEVLPGEDGVEVRLSTGEAISGRFFVDGTGHRSVLGRALGLFDGPPLRTASTARFTHLRAVAPADGRIATGRACGVTMPLSSGTLHHVFPGGWMWVIPFDNQPGSVNPLCSVGLCLSPRGPDPGASPPEEAFGAVVAQLPSVAAHLAGAAPARPWVGTGRLQYRASRLVGPRWALAPHAAGFVDALFSRGLYNTVAGVDLLADAILASLAGAADAPARLGRYERRTLDALAVNDALVAAAYGAFASFSLWNAWHRVWALGALYESQALALRHLEHQRTGDPAWLEPGEGGAGLPVEIPSWRRLFEDSAAVIDAVEAGRQTPSAAADALFQMLASSPAVPPPLRYADPRRRYLDATGPLSNLALRRWARSDRAPEEIGRLFDYSVGSAVRALARRRTTPPA